MRRSNRNVGPPKFYGKRVFIDVVDEPQLVPGAASNRIVLGNNISDHSDQTHQEILSDIMTIQSNPSSLDPLSSSLTDESLRIAVDNFDDNIDLDSEHFNTKFENVINSKTSQNVFAYPVLYVFFCLLIYYNTLWIVNRLEHHSTFFRINTYTSP